MPARSAPNRTGARDPQHERTRAGSNPGAFAYRWLIDDDLHGLLGRRFDGATLLDTGHAIEARAGGSPQSTRGEPRASRAQVPQKVR